MKGSNSNRKYTKTTYESYKKRHPKDELCLNNKTPKKNQPKRSMYVALKVIALMVKELLRIYTEENTLENLKMVNDTDRELLLGQTKENTLENGKMINDTDREL